MEKCPRPLWVRFLFFKGEKMGFLSRVGEDFKDGLFKDIDALDIVFLALLLGALMVTLLSKKIAKRFMEGEEAALRLSVKIKTAGFILTVILALVITQVF